MAKVNKFSDKVKKIERKDTVDFISNDGEVISFAVESRSEKDIDAVNSKYDAQKPKVPTKRLPVAGGKFKTIEDTDNVEYRQALARVQKANFAELALLFLAEDERPEGTLEEQLEAIGTVNLAGFIPKVVQRGLEISGVIEEETYEEELTEAKND